MSTKIEWCNWVWNPVTGCSKVSTGCKNCYAEMMAKRFWGSRKFTDVQCHFDRLDQPLHWRKPRRIFVNSMGDLFHENVPFDFIGKVWQTMGIALQHIFIILTKSPQRILDFWEWTKMDLKETGLNEWHKGYDALSNVWLGVSVEDQIDADNRIPLLLQSRAAIRFVSIEPMLGIINLLKYIDVIDWVILGGESGNKARPMHPDWVRYVRDQCVNVSVPFFFKQWGSWAPDNLTTKTCKSNDFGMYKVGKKNAGYLLDGKVWRQFPQ